MKSATELLGEMLKIYDEPDTGAGDLHSWLHQNVEDVRGVVERGDDTARLDWLENSEVKSIYCEGEEDSFSGWWKVRDEWDGSEGEGQTLRAAIDRARGEGE